MPTKPNQILLLPTGTGEPRQLTHSDINHTYARWVPDGRIVFIGNEPGHPERSFLLDTNGNEKPITPEGVVAWAITTDGKNMIVSDLGRTQFQLVAVDGGEPHPLSQFQKGDFPADFTPDDKSVLVRRFPNSGTAEIWSVELAGGKRTLLRSFTPPGVRAVSRGLNPNASRDGKNFAFTYHLAISTEYLVDGVR